MNMKIVVLFLIMLSLSNAAKVNNNYPAGSIVTRNGKLQVKGLQLVNSQGQAIQLRGVSTHGPQWFENCYSLESFQALVRDWKVDIIRIAMYVTEGGYNDKPDYWKERVTQYVKWAGQLGVYCLIDWHVMNPGNPSDSSYDRRFDFFKSMTLSFANTDHVLYEIANEPNNVQWSQVQTYAEQMIQWIRRFDSNTIIIIGTPQWSSDLPSVTPVNFINIMYTFHFYAASHYTQDMVSTQASRIPIFVTEFGTCEYTGNGRLDLTNADKWIDIFNGNNKGAQKISFINWAYSECNESCAALTQGSCGAKNWNSVSASGQWVKAKTTQAH